MAWNQRNGPRRAAVLCDGYQQRVSIDVTHGDAEESIATGHCLKVLTGDRGIQLRPFFPGVVGDEERAIGSAADAEGLAQFAAEAEQTYQVRHRNTVFPGAPINCLE